MATTNRGGSNKGGRMDMPVLYEASSEDADSLQQQQQQQQRMTHNEEEEDMTSSSDNESYSLHSHDDGEEETVGMLDELDDFVEHVHQEQQSWAEDISFGTGSLLMEGVHGGHRPEEKETNSHAKSVEQETTSVNDSSLDSSYNNLQNGDVSGIISMEESEEEEENEDDDEEEDEELVSYYEEVTVEDEDFVVGNNHETSMEEGEGEEDAFDEFTPNANDSPSVATSEGCVYDQEQEEEEEEGEEEEEEEEISQKIKPSEDDHLLVDDSMDLTKAEQVYTSEENCAIYDEKIELESDKDGNDANNMIDNDSHKVDAHLLYSDENFVSDHSRSTGTLEQPILVIDETEEEHEENSDEIVGGTAVIGDSNLEAVAGTAGTPIFVVDEPYDTEEGVYKSNRIDFMIDIRKREHAVATTEVGLEDNNRVSIHHLHEEEYLEKKEVDVSFVEREVAEKAESSASRNGENTSLTENCECQHQGHLLTSNNNYTYEDIEGDAKDSFETIIAREDLVMHVIGQDELLKEESQYEEISQDDSILESEEEHAVDEDYNIGERTSVDVIPDHQSSQEESHGSSNPKHEMEGKSTGIIETNSRNTESHIHRTRYMEYSVEADCEHPLVDEKMPLDEVFVGGTLNDDESVTFLEPEISQTSSGRCVISENDDSHCETDPSKNQECRELVAITIPEEQYSTGYVEESGILTYDPEQRQMREENRDFQLALVLEPMKRIALVPEPMKRIGFGRNYSTCAATYDVEKGCIVPIDDKAIVLHDTVNSAIEEHKLSSENAAASQRIESERKDSDRTSVESAGDDLRACMEAFGYYLDQRQGNLSLEQDIHDPGFLRAGLEPPSGSGIYGSVPWTADPEIEGAIIVRRDDISRIPSSLLGDFARNDDIIRSILVDSLPRATPSVRSESVSVYTTAQEDVPTPLVKETDATDRLGTSLVVPAGMDDADEENGAEYSVIAESLGMGGVEDALLENHSNKTENHSNKTEKGSRKSVTWNEFAQVKSDDPFLSGPLRVGDTASNSRRRRLRPRKPKGDKIKKALEIFYDAPFWTKVLVYVSISMFCIAFGIILTAVVGNKKTETANSGIAVPPWFTSTNFPTASPTLSPTFSPTSIIMLDPTEGTGEQSNSTASPTFNETLAPLPANNASDPADVVTTLAPSIAPSTDTTSAPVRAPPPLWGWG